MVTAFSSVHLQLTHIVQGILSRSVTARPFDKVPTRHLCPPTHLNIVCFKDADGLVRGEACGGILLESAENTFSRLSVEGSMTNSDSLGLQPGQPDQDAEERVIMHSLDTAGVSGKQIKYTEMHGEQLLLTVG